MGYHEGIAKAPFIVQIDKDRCNGCGLCINTCNVKALSSSGKQQPVLLQEQVCLGCGACLPACKQNALALVKRPENKMPPKNRTEMMAKRLFERGRAIPFVVSGTKKRLKKLLASRKGKGPKVP